MTPIAEHTQAFELSHLDGDLLGGIGAAFGLHVVAREVAAMLFLDGVFNRQAVAIPAGDVLCVKPFELARLDDHVLQNLIHRMAHVDLAVGIRRAIMQDELRCIHPGIAQHFVDAFFIRFLHPTRLALGQVAAHGEGRIGQI